MEKSATQHQTVAIDNSGEWTEVISSKRPWWSLNLREIWRYRDLILLLVRRDFIAVYKQTILGPLWHFITPLFSTIVYLVVFGNIARLPTDGIPPFLFYLSGVTFWNYFSKCLNSTAETFFTNQYIFSKVYFPRLVMPISQVMSAGIGFLIQFSLFIFIYIIFALKGVSFQISWQVGLLPLAILLMVCLGLGLGIIVSSLTTKYHDLRHAITFGVQLFMYATPVIYPLSMVEGKWKLLLLLNPLTSIIELFRLSIMGQGFFSWYWFAYSVLTCLIVLLVGIFLFNKVERTFIDTI